ncbi:MAG: hypothetical protein AAGJ46_15025 [Planctomycetota bacterium]
MEEPKDRPRSGVPPRDWAPLWLSAIAAAALMASLAASAFRQPPMATHAPVAQRQRPLANPWPTAIPDQAAARAPRFIMPLASEPPPSLLVLPAMSEQDVAREIAEALRQAAPTPRIVAVDDLLIYRRPALPAGEPAAVSFDPRIATHLPRWANEPLGGLPFAMVLPAGPAWQAGYARGPAFRIDWPRVAAKAHFASPARIGEAVGEISNRLAATPRRVIAAASRRLEPSAIPYRARSYAAEKAWPLRVGPGDRIAFAQTPWRTGPPTPRVAAAEPRFVVPRYTGPLADEVDAPPAEASPITAEEPSTLKTLRDAAATLLDFTPIHDAAEWSMRVFSPSSDEDNSNKGSPTERPDAPRDQSSSLRQAALEYPFVQVTAIEELDAGPKARPIESAELDETLHAIRATSPLLQDPDAWLAYARSCRLRGHGSPALLDERASPAARPIGLRLAARPSAGAIGPTPGLHAYAAKPEAEDTPLSVVLPIEATRTPGAPRLAQSVAQRAQSLSEPSDARRRQLAEQIEARYRNANLRVAIADPLLERFLPIPEPRLEPVRDHIAGAFVRGQSTTDTRLSIRLLPDPHVLRIGLEARGVVQARTVAEPGPVTVRNRSHTSFLAQKTITVDPTGVRADPAICSSYNQTRLTGLGSRFDRVPVLATVVRSRAIDEVGERKPLAKRQSEVKVNRRVSKSIDQQTDEAIARIRARYQSDLQQRAEVLGVKVAPLELRTTEHRLIARLRVAGDRQIAASTPRNQAPGDSWASVQLHESVVNNAVAGLELGGRRFTPDELQRHLRSRLQLPEPEPSDRVDEEEQDAQLVFDPADPVRVAFAEGQAELVLGIRELRMGRKRYSRFKVHAFYEPQADGMQARLVRSGGVQIEGRMRTGTRLRLHGVFGEVLKEDRPVPLLGAKLAADPRLGGLMVTQLVMTDGWLGLAIGPEQVAGKGRRVATVGRYVR